MRRFSRVSIVLASAALLLAGCTGRTPRSSDVTGRSTVPTVAPGTTPTASPTTTPTTTPTTCPTTTAVPPPETQGVAGGYGCEAALAYLAAHAAPGFRFVCPGDADGHDGMMCDDYVPRCPGDKVIVIARPCPVVYMNEASNSLVAEGLSSAPIDSYPGACPR